MNKHFTLLFTLFLLFSCSGGNIDEYNQNQLSLTKTQQGLDDFYGFGQSTYLAEGEEVKIAILLPLTGERASIGKQILNAAELALFDNSSFNNQATITLLPIDTKGQAYNAREAFSQALASEPSVILGPLFSESTRAILSDARKTNVPVISFSNDAKLLNQGVYLLGFMPEDQISKVLNYAVNQGYQDFSALLPDTEYGSIAFKAYQDELLRYNLPSDRIFWYEGENADLSEVLEKVIAQAGSYRSKQMNDLFIPEGGRNLVSIYKRLKSQRALKNFRLLGTGSWEDEYITKNEELAGSLFASSPVGVREFFEQSFEELFEYKPIRVASLGYDAVALVSAIARNGQRITEHAILNPAGFAGVNGTFRFHPNGKNERLLSVLEITSKGAIEALPARDEF